MRGYAAQPPRKRARLGKGDTPFSRCIPLGQGLPTRGPGRRLCLCDTAQGFALGIYQGAFVLLGTMTGALPLDPAKGLRAPRPRPRAIAPFGYHSPGLSRPGTHSSGLSRPDTHEQGPSFVPAPLRWQPAPNSFQGARRPPDHAGSSGARMPMTGAVKACQGPASSKKGSS